MAGGLLRSAQHARTALPTLLPAAQERMAIYELPLVPTKAFLHWTFGRDTVIWRIWPAVALHTLLAAVVVTVSLKTDFTLDIPPVLLTVLGVVIGFVISYRASSGYDRYWMGRQGWSDVIKNSRTLARLIWFHVPLRVVPASASSGKSDVDLDMVAKQVMAEKRIALDLIEAFAVSMKHHLRGERGVFYEDLYPLVKDLHQHGHHHKNHRAHAQNDSSVPHNEDGVLMAHPGAGPTPGTASAAVPVASIKVSPASPGEARVPLPRTTSPQPPSSTSIKNPECNPIIPAINSYGTFDPARPGSLVPTLRHMQSSSSLSSNSSGPPELQPGEVHTDRRASLANVQSDLIPFVAVFRGIGWLVKQPFRALYERVGTHDHDHEYGPACLECQDSSRNSNPEYDGESGGVQRRWGRADVNESSGPRHRPRYAGGGENIPLEVVRALSTWFAVLEERGTVPGTSMGTMIGTLTAFEDSLSTLERILTTPLPFVYSVHIRHTVWIYLCFLPFQLIGQFKWYAIPGVAMAAFIYLGFLAAGEEIEQPFGYDENDLDLDMFCRDVVCLDLEHLRRTAAPNAFIGQSASVHTKDGRLPATPHEVFCRIIN